MAGISFSLQRVLRSDSSLVTASGHVYAALAIAGPWLFVSTSISLLRTLAPATAHGYFQCLLVYGYAGSLLLTSAIQLGSARFMGNVFYLHQWKDVTPTFATSSLLALMGHLAAGGVFAWATRMSWPLALAFVAFLGTLAILWQGIALLGVLRDFGLLSAFLAVGAVASVLGAVELGGRWGTPGYLLGFTAGHALIVGLLGARIRTDFPSGGALQPQLVPFLRRNRRLILIGLVLWGGAWADRILFWHGPAGVGYGPGLWACPLYDVPSFLAYLTVLPALAVVFIRLEGTFATKCRRFLTALNGASDLDTIQARRRDLEGSVRLTLFRILQLQGPLTLLAIVLAPALFSGLHLDPSQFYIFRIACLTALANVLLLATTLSALHLEEDRLALALAGGFLFLSCALTFVTLRLGWSWYGYGALAAALVTLSWGIPALLRKLREIEYVILMRRSGKR